MYKYLSTKQQLQRAKAIRTLRKLGITIVEISDSDIPHYCTSKAQAVGIKNIARTIHMQFHRRFMLDAQTEYHKRVRANRQRAKQKA